MREQSAGQVDLLALGGSSDRSDPPLATGLNCSNFCCAMLCISADYAVSRCPDHTPVFPPDRAIECTVYEKL